MPAPGETDLGVLLADLAVARRAGTFRFVEVVDPDPAELAAAEAVVREEDTTTLVVPATENGPAGVLDVAWLTLTVSSSLEAVGLLAAVGVALAEAGIPCNVLAGVRHDHLLVPVELADDAVQLLSGAIEPAGRISSS